MTGDRAVELLNRSGARSAKRRDTFSSWCQRAGVRPTLRHLLLLQLDPLDLAALAQETNILLFLSDFERYGAIKGRTAKILVTQYGVMATVHQVFKVYAGDAHRLFRGIGYDLTPQDLHNFFRCGQRGFMAFKLKLYADIVKPAPSARDIAAILSTMLFPPADSSIEAFLAFGHPVTASTILNLCGGLGSERAILKYKQVHIDIVEIMEFGLSVNFLCALFFRCPTDPLIWDLHRYLHMYGYSDDEVVAFMRARFFIRRVQSAIRKRRLHKAAKAIQRRWRMCISNPAFAVARRRLEREFSAM